MSFLTELETRLEALAQSRQTQSYGSLAKDLGLRMAALTDALEILMEQDARAGRPLRAALVAARHSPGVPAPGFFIKASELGVYDGRDPSDFLENQQKALWR